MERGAGGLRLFGTDGVRGVANRDITAELAIRLGRGAARVLGGAGRPRVLIGRDPRLSGDMLEGALAAGLMSAGADVALAGVLPTAAVAYLTRREGFSLGAMISASHNPVPDNGIKFFAADGYKLPDAVEDRIESAMDDAGMGPTGEGVGRLLECGGLKETYIQHVRSLAGRPYQGRVVVDGAYGSAATVLPEALSAAARELSVVAGVPDGSRINVACGSTCPSFVAARRAELGGDIGLAFDGDADRMIAIDEEGELVDGDITVALLSTWLRQRGMLSPSEVALTVMSNGGVRDFLLERGISVRETRVGDRYVIEAMRAGGLMLGGEQSGHIIYQGAATTGDGLATAVLLLSALGESGQRLADFRKSVPRYPQRLESVRVGDRDAALKSPAYLSELEAARHALGESGRVLVRPSGTEPLVRVMVEARSAELAETWLGRLSQSLLGGE